MRDLYIIMDKDNNTQTGDQDNTKTSVQESRAISTRVAVKTRSDSPVPSKKSRKHSEVSSPLSPASDEILSAPPSEVRMVQLLQDALKPIQDRLDDLTETHAESEAEHEYFHSAINQLNTDNKDLQERLVVLERENKILKDRLINQEAYSRRNNLRFHGMAESKFDNAEEKVLHYLHSHGLNFHPRSIERAHRLGAYTSGKTRPIILKFLHFKDRDVVWRKLGHGLIPPGFNKPHVHEDYPMEVDDARSQLLPIAIAALNKRDPVNNKQPKVQMIVDKLYINNQRYTKDTINSLPGSLHPREIFTPTNKDKTAFFTRNSPLSNHYPSPFKLNGEQFNCLEQYIMVEKARNFGDQQAVVRITKESNLVRQKQIGKTINGFHKQNWEEVAEEKILPGMLAKFTQNETCRAVLLNTGDNLLIEGNPHDLFFGAGVPLYSPDIWQPSKYKGKNVMGKMLQRVREQMKNQQEDIMEIQDNSTSNSA